MATIGLDCELIIDGVGYFVKPGSFTIKHPRIRKASVRADGSEWSMIILCLNDLLKYDGTSPASLASSIETPCAPATSPTP